ncbi:MAG: hypothetical protein ACTSR2_00210 [Candidatus Hodarchaeales archaeon]
MLVKNVYTSIDADVVEIVDKIRKEYGLSFRQIVNDAIRHYWEQALKPKEEEVKEKESKKGTKKKAKRKG